MPLSAARRVTLIGEILGLPLDANGTIVTALTHFPFSNVQVWEPAFNHGTYTNLIAAIDAKLLAMTAEAQAAIESLVDEFLPIHTSPLKVDGSVDGSKGRLIDHEAQRENIRQSCANILGIAVPRGGFLAEVRATYGASLAQWTNAPGIRDR